MRISSAGSEGKGFTLLELLVVLAITGLVVALAPPMLPNVLDSLRVKQAARELSTALQLARGQAIARQDEVTLLLDVNERFYTIGKVSRQLTVPDDTYLVLTTATVEQVSEDSGRIRFFADGSSTGGRIEIRRAPHQYIIDVNWLTGRVSIMP